MKNYKSSHYNHFIYLEDENTYLIYNSISNGLAKLEPEVFNLLNSGKEGIAKLEGDQSKKDMIDQLHKGNIIIDSDFDEIEFLRTRFNMGKFGQKNLFLTIIPTNDCNLDCLYCYEGNRAHKYPYDVLEEDIFKFTAERIKSIGYKSLHVTWYGGEPLLNKEFIFSLSKKLMRLCKDQKLNYGAMIVTNGTLLNKTTAESLKRYKIGYVQITIDGPQEIHDQRRPVKNSKKSSYHTIVRNVEWVLGIIPIQIRVNVDKTNFSNTVQLLETLEKKGFLERPRDISIYLGYTREWTYKCSNILPVCFSMKEFSEAELEFQKSLIARGFNVSNIYPNPQAICVAVTPNGFVIEPGGEIHKCWSDVGIQEAYLGNVREPLELNGKLLKWLSYDPLSQSPGCRECKFFPICGGGCPYVFIKQREKLMSDKNYNCTPWKILLKEKIRLFLEAKAKEVSKKTKNK
ncbi:MAG: SPASM domain-containing protein [Candidatus Aminicenantes bacterium]|nr:SPASM domain-containing protein [Candidatus Aminicenantes bacterium]NIM79122.1 SPASM domain-containing protein [Candidatus Aminicenantes bacterium]NIN18407.1 SPASM domain-containing protein [Candidatus Aminicenantes bacterium]NIN42295.1 SPASM domain-containing protein [Candidatus Aminicenantes bacterium]NIN85061.1 SPASM domain-containing protein [Candidatus Aminicenantes bacterium]